MLEDQVQHIDDNTLKIHHVNGDKERDEEYSRPPMMSGTSVCPQATQAIFGRIGATFPCLFFLGGGGPTEKAGASVVGLAAAGFGAAGLRTRLGLMVSPCVGRIDFSVYGGIADCDRSASNSGEN